MNKRTVAASWTEWSDALRRRYLRISMRHAHPGMTFFNWPTLTLVSQRVEPSQWTFNPAVQLSLYLTRLERSSSDQRQSAPSTYTVGARPLQMTSYQAGAREFSAAFTAEQAEVTSVDQARSLALGSRSQGRNQRDWDDELGIPLARVFARSPGNRDSDSSVSAGTDVLPPEDRRGIPLRLAEQGKRVEERVSPLTMSHPQLVEMPPKARETQEIETRSPWGTRVNAPGMAQSQPSSPLLDIERLTDQVVRQIDSRILAHRERTGNLF